MIPCPRFFVTVAVCWEFVDWRAITGDVAKIK